MTNFWRNKRVCITGSTGFLGSHLTTRLKELGANLFLPTSTEYDLRKPFSIDAMLCDAGKQVDILINLAANVGGIGYNQAHPYSLYFDNACIGLHLIDLAIKRGVKKFVQIGTVCAYPKHTPVPFDERCLWDGYPEETNAPYGLAKRNTLVQLQAARLEYGFNGIYLLPTNLYGEGDEFNPEQSHVIPALIKKFDDAITNKQDEVTVWGSGNASRDFLYAKDAISGIILLTEKYDSGEPVNLGSGKEVSISLLTHHIGQIMGYSGRVRYDRSKPDGQPRRSLRTWRATDLGWKPEVDLRDGLKQTIEWYQAQR